jgi:hypothetical protein
MNILKILEVFPKLKKQQDLFLIHKGKEKNNYKTDRKIINLNNKWSGCIGSGEAA